MPIIAELNTLAINLPTRCDTAVQLTRLMSHSRVYAGTFDPPPKNTFLYFSLLLWYKYIFLSLLTNISTSIVGEED